ncbi:PTS glucitol/sorbitol transporter subunit IIC, partial [Staphylococcus sp. 231237_7MaSpsaltlick]
MDFIVKLAEGFINLFQTGADTFIDWMTTIVPLVLMLLIAMNTLIQLIGEKRINIIAQKSSK